LRPKKTKRTFFTNLNREVGIGANCYFLELGDASVLLDCGMHPKREGEDATPMLEHLRGMRLDAMFLTHAHLDHIGSLPMAMRSQPGVPVFMTATTARIGDAMLHNSINVMSRQRDELGIKEYPLFTHQEAERLTEHWVWRKYRQRYAMDGERTGSGEAGPSFQFHEAGHILGAAAVLFEAGDAKLLYTGDINFADQTICRAARLPEEPVDVLIIETTRGDTIVPPAFSREAEEQRLADAVERVFDRGGAVLIPVFALGKTQEVLGIIYEMKRAGRLRGCPVYIGGLSTKITEIIDRMANETPRLHAGLNLMDAASPFSIDGGRIDSEPIRPGRLYTLSSGMMTEKTLSHAIAKRFLAEAKNAIFFVGYADPESPAGRLQAAGRGATFVYEESPRKTLEVNCEIEKFDFSAHASRETIRAYINKVQPRQVLLVHGDLPAMEWFRAAVQEDLPGSEVIIPQPGEPVELKM
jgi:Cft2 family RNA processing exonuclease